MPPATPAQHKFQSPKGTRDFYPADMAVRRYIESIWRKVSINHGFEEVDGPTFEHLDLYTHKSGPGIVSEIFQVFSGKDEEQIRSIRAGGDAPFALRPEFTPTLARMVAAKAAELPRPIKWFATPTMFRAERPQRGRLREHFQWNVDFMGGDVRTEADAEIIATAVAALDKLGLQPGDVVVGYSNRLYVQEILIKTYGLPEDNLDAMFVLLDEGTKIGPEQFDQRAIAMGIAPSNVDWFSTFAGVRPLEGIGRWDTDSVWIEPLKRAIQQAGVSEWCDFRPGIVRGLAYYTGTVFEIIAEGERAIAGGGRYDNLIESFGGPSLPACGFGMGDVVLANILHDKGLLPEEVIMQPLRPHVFVISSGKEQAEAELPKLVAQLRRAGYHVRHSYRSTRNVGKLLGEAGKARARLAIILGDELAEGKVAVKNLDTGEQGEPVSRDGLESSIKAMLSAVDV
jgi:histidyl-tRNA synthetase